MNNMGIAGASTVSRKMTTHTIQHGRFAGRSLELWQLDFGDIGTASNEALEYWKRAYLSTYTRNADLIQDKELAEKLVREVFDKAAQMTPDDLPTKNVKQPIPKPGGGFVVDKNGDLVTIEKEQDYLLWWTLSTSEGRSYVTRLSLRQSPAQADSMTIDMINLMFAESLTDMLQVVMKIIELSLTQILKNLESLQRSDGSAADLLNGDANPRETGNGTVPTTAAGTGKPIKATDKKTAARLRQIRRQNKRRRTLNDLAGL